MIFIDMQSDTVLHILREWQTQLGKCLYNEKPVDFKSDIIQVFYLEYIAKIYECTNT